MDSRNIARIFNLVQNEFADCIKAEFVHTTSQLDILIDILIKDGNSILKRDWLNKLYEKELDSLRQKTKELNKELISEKPTLDVSRIRDYKIYKSCVHEAYFNDDENNRDAKITDDELSILVTLTKALNLSQEEVKLINYLIIPPIKSDIDEVINFLKNIGVIFYSKKINTVYVADEMVMLLRRIRKKDVADKYFKRVLRLLKDSQINQLCRNHNISYRDIDTETKIKQLIKEGISFSDVLFDEMYKPGTTLTEKKKVLNELWTDKLKFEGSLKGSTLEEKVENLISHFNELEKDEKVGISIEGYERLITDLKSFSTSFDRDIRAAFEIEDRIEIESDFLLDLNIKPRDLLDNLSKEDLKRFAEGANIKSRGDIALNILEAYTDIENLFIENYTLIGTRDLASLKENGINIKESELGLKFEDITGEIFKQLGFNVDYDLKNQISTNKNKIDLILNLGNQDLMIVECKTSKDSSFNKFSTVSRQIKSYINTAEKSGYNVVKSLLIAPEFSDDFINECGLEFEINLSLITAESLSKILEYFRESKHEKLPYQLFMKDVLIREDRIQKALKK
ncbi:restriction endonuclease [Luteibaculum oceani]|uniref:Uncharacterized protein n=1 Tax=Luteibaculum oceani TaxID=1294296 RepID=A0A5C6VJH0_9FLAO|nr:restriction endonuclease [Luteibaculum oceani]TXC85040.1 hypothetical protein FRX97_00005 [Luteibaculum oceani]